jgi:hypothetical protein
VDNFNGHSTVYARNWCDYRCLRPSQLFSVIRESPCDFFSAAIACIDSNDRYTRDYQLALGSYSLLSDTKFCTRELDERRNPLQGNKKCLTRTLWT